MNAVTAEYTFRVGERVYLRSGGEDREAEVIEDPLGDLSDRYVRIRIERTETEPLEITVVADRLRPVPAA